MKITRLVSVVVILSVFASGANAQQCSHAYIDPAKLPSDPGAQETPVWCWAASLSYIFAYYQHAVSQCDIVSKYYNGCPAVPGNPKTMGSSLNRRWTDIKGDSFAVSAVITDGYWGSTHNVDNDDVIDALDNDKPVFYATTNHAMVLISVDYYRTPQGPVIVSGKAWDPNPTYHRNGNDGIRDVSGADLQAHYVAIPTLSKGRTAKVIPPDAPAKAIVPGRGGDANEFCPVLEQAVGDASNGFALILGEKRDSSSYKTDAVLPGAEECWIYKGDSASASPHKKYTCTFAAGSYVTLSASVESCLVKDGYNAPIKGHLDGKEAESDFGGKEKPLVLVHNGEADRVSISVREILPADPNYPK